MLFIYLQLKNYFFNRSMFYRGMKYIYTCVCKNTVKNVNAEEFWEVEWRRATRQLTRVWFWWEPLTWVAFDWFKITMWPVPKTGDVRQCRPGLIWILKIHLEFELTQSNHEITNEVKKHWKRTKGHQKTQIY